MRVVLIFLALAVSLQAQQSNFHAAATIDSSRNLGFANPTFGVTAGGDIRKGRFNFSTDGSLDRIRKNQGGSGYQVAVSEAARLYFHKNIFAEGVTRQWHYSVRQFSKSGVEVGGGAGFETKHSVNSVVYRQLVWETARNQTKTLEGNTQWFLSHHLYFGSRFRGAWFKNQGSARVMSGIGIETQIGLWFK